MYAERGLFGVGEGKLSENSASLFHQGPAERQGACSQTAVFYQVPIPLRPPKRRPVVVPVKPKNLQLAATAQSGVPHARVQYKNLHNFAMVLAALFLPSHTHKTAIYRTGIGHMLPS